MKKCDDYKIRKCLNCSKEWKVKTDSRTRSRKQLFCNDCVPILSDWEKKCIKFNSSPEERNHYLGQKRAEFLRNYKRQILLRVKRRALVKGLEFSLEESDIVIPDKCPLLEIPIVIGTKGDYEQSPSIDRIDNSKGYIPSNIWIISKKANSMKNSATLEELMTFCKNILRYSPNNIENEDIESIDKEL